MGQAMAVAREREVEARPEGTATAPKRRGLPFAVGLCVLVVEVAWIAGLAYLVWLLVALL
jgi:hypothetical protein